MSVQVTDDSACSFWPTVTTSDSNGSGYHGAGGTDLRTKAKEWWPTSTVNGNHNVAGMTPTSGNGLETSAKQWATPTARDWKDTGNNVNYQRLADKSRLAGQVMVFSLPDLTPIGQPFTRDCGQRRLNPLFVEWLMGLPEGWISLEQRNCTCSAMELSRFRQRLHCRH